MRTCGRRGVKGLSVMDEDVENEEVGPVLRRSLEWGRRGGWGLEERVKG